MAKKSAQEPTTPQPSPEESAGPKAPSLEDLIADGYPEREAVGMLAGITAETAGKTKDECDAAYEQALSEYDSAQASPPAEPPPPPPQAKAPKPPKPPRAPKAPAQAPSPEESAGPFYRVVSTSRRGTFWRIGRQFTRHPTDIPLKELTAAQQRELETSNPHFLSVTLING